MMHLNAPVVVGCPAKLSMALLLFCIPSDEDDLQDVKSAVVDLAARWQDLGDTLGVRPGDLDTILADNPHSCSNRLRSVLVQWLRQNYMVCTSSILVLKSTHFIYFTSPLEALITLIKASTLTL